MFGKIWKAVVMGALTGAMLVISVIPVSAGSWEWIEDHWRYRGDDGRFKSNEWFTDGGHDYHFDSFGNMDTGMRSIGNRWYRFNDEGHLIYNNYDAATGYVSTNDGSIYRPEDGGFLAGQITIYDENYDTLYLEVVNYSNKPIVFNGYVSISSPKFFEMWYSGSGGTAEKVAINPMETKTIPLKARDGHPLNFSDSDIDITAWYTLNGESYYLWTYPEKFSENRTFMIMHVY